MDLRVATLTKLAAQVHGDWIGERVVALEDLPVVRTRSMIQSRSRF